MPQEEFSNSSCFSHERVSGKGQKERRRDSERGRDGKEQRNVELPDLSGAATQRMVGGWEERVLFSIAAGFKTRNAPAVHTHPHTHTSNV